MPIEPGTRLGPYDVLSAIGAGGMGEVYRARDTSLDRDVAIKVLPDAFANDPERLARFEREAKVLASLNHPNIGGIYGLEDSGETHALVLELVEGPTLADRIAQGPIPVDEALPIAKQIAEALEAAHEQGIIHRDLKPANIKLRPDGTVKVLDFGLAKALEGEHAQADQANSPTLTAAASQMGVIIGTAAYMSPEQARGKPVDRRADIWAFGVVLHEMLTGQRAFEGEDVSLTLSQVLQREPEWDALPEDVSSTLLTFVRRCLQKDPRQRVRDIGDVRLAMEGAFETGGSAAADTEEPGAPPALWQRPVFAAAALAIALALGGLAVWSLTPPSQAVPVVRMSVRLADDERFVSLARARLAVSPDGSRIVYATTSGLKLRPVDQLEATLIPGTSADTVIADPFFSPDGQWVGYQASGQLKKVSIDGGVPVVLGDADFLWGASWVTDDTILFGQGGEGIWQVPGTGGTSEQLIAVEVGELAQSPQMLPGGEWVLFSLRPVGTSGWDEAQIVVQSVATGERQVLIEGGHAGVYVPTGHLVFARDGVLLGVPFDLRERVITGEPVSLIEGVQDSTVGRTGGAPFAVANTGSLVYVPGRAGSTQVELVWVDRAGQTEPLAAEPRGYTWARVSPDGTRVALDVRGADNPDILIYDVTRDTLTRLTFDEAVDAWPLWTPDGSRVVFYSDRDSGGLFWKAADGTGEVERLMENPNAPKPYGWTADGRLVFDQSPGDIGVVAVGGNARPELLLDEAFREGNPAISPDGRWIAYDSTESGDSEVYVRPFPDIDTGKWQVSSERGFDPVWSPDGRELFFLGGGDALWVTRVETEPTFNWTRPVPLLDARAFPTGRGTEYDIAPDGERFIFQKVLDEEVVSETTLIFVLNWFSELQGRVPTGR